MLKMCKVCSENLIRFVDLELLMVFKRGINTENKIQKIIKKQKQIRFTTKIMKKKLLSLGFILKFGQIV